MTEKAAIPFRQTLREQIESVTAECTGCGACTGSCAFLKRYGTPKEIAERVSHALPVALTRAFECSLCGLCAEVCPMGLNPPDLFLEMRREAVDRGLGAFPEHAPLLAYERIGTSRRFTFYRLPHGCRTIFFPGCGLSGTRPEAVRRVFDRLCTADPKTGIVLDCCMKPSRSLGHERHAAAMFEEMQGFLLGHGVEEVLVACPNCHDMFRSLGKGLSVRTVYEALLEQEIPAGSVKGTVTVHDPCVMRGAETVHSSVRSLLKKQGLTVEEMPHSMNKTLCCGQGGGVNLLAPDLAKSWGMLRKEEAAGRRIVTYCAGCTQSLDGCTPTSHLLDVLFEPEETLSGKKKGAAGLLTYLNRIMLKRGFRQTAGPAATRERTFAHEQVRKRSRRLSLALILLAAAILVVHLTGASRYLSQDRLQDLITASGALAPAAYILLYTLAPVLLLPGLPITIAGGIVFGPVWGVVYTIIGSTMGATLAFLAARYLARGWVSRRLSGPKWEKLETEVEKHGWKMVAFTRLVPAFPFNLLNYAFGLTRVKLLHYVAATFIFMLPACIAFIVFSSSLPDLIRGKVPPAALVGMGLIVLVSLIPVIYKRIKGKQADRTDR